MPNFFVFEPSVERQSQLVEQLNGADAKIKFFTTIEEFQKSLNNNERNGLILIDIDFVEQNIETFFQNLLLETEQKIIGFSKKTAAELLPLIFKTQMLIVPLTDSLALNLQTVIKSITEHNLNIFSQPEKDSSIQFIGKSPAVQMILSKLDLVALSDVHILITGETGSGKTVLAKLIHQKSKRRNFPFFHINCAAIPEQLLEAELFGFKKGAFTGAVRDSVGKLKAAGKGTILLDEIGEMPVHLQAKILRVLDEKLYFPVGAVKTEKMHARIIAATNKNIEEEIQKKNFRQDLYYRLNTFEIHIPPLRERKEDIPFLFDYYLDNYRKKYNIKKPKVWPYVYEVLRQYHWPGNIRELQNMVETIMFLKPKQITLELLPQKFFGNRTATIIKAAQEKLSLTELKRDYARYVYKLMGNNKSKTAKVLGIDIKTLRKMLQ